MNKFFLTTLFLGGFLFGSCDKVKDTPEPNLFDSLTLNTITDSTVYNGNSEIDILGANNFKTDVSIRIKTQPQFGQILLDAVKKVFVYHPNPSFHGHDFAIYEVCKGSACKEDTIKLFVSEDTICHFTLPQDLTETAEAGVVKILDLPASFGCDAKITEVTSNYPAYLTLDSTGRIRASFPDTFQTISNIPFTIKVCSAETCLTTLVQFSVTNYCADIFQPKDTIVTKHAFEKRFSVRIKYILERAIQCPDSEIDESTFTIVTQPSIGTATISQGTDSTGSVSGPLFLKLDRNAVGLVNGSLTYSVKHRGVTRTANVFYNFIP